MKAHGLPQRPASRIPTDYSPSGLPGMAKKVFCCPDGLAELGSDLGRTAPIRVELERREVVSWEDAGEGLLERVVVSPARRKGTFAAL